MMPLNAWTTGYEVVAAADREEAHQIVLNMKDRDGNRVYDPSEVDGEGWIMLHDDYRPFDEDLRPMKQTMGEAVRERGGPGHLWSLEPQ